MAKFIKLTQIKRVWIKENEKQNEHVITDEVIINTNVINKVRDLKVFNTKDVEAINNGANSAIDFSNYSTYIYFAQTKEEIWAMLNA